MIRLPSLANTRESLLSKEFAFMPPMNRWYDQERICHHLMEQLQLISQPEAQVFCGRLLSHLAEQMR